MVPIDFRVGTVLINNPFKILLQTAGNALKLSILPPPRYFCIIFLKIFYDPNRRTFLALGGGGAPPLPTGLHSKCESH